MAFWQIVFWAAAAYNVVIGAGGLFQPGAAREGRVIGLLVIAFGVVYAIAALDPERFAPMLWAGVLGKAGVIALMLPAARGPGGVPRLGWILAGDALFLALFLAFLLGRG
jgi:hypothetical protein